MLTEEMLKVMNDVQNDKRESEIIFWVEIIRLNLEIMLDKTTDVRKEMIIIDIINALFYGEEAIALTFNRPDLLLRNSDWKTTEKIRLVSIWETNKVIQHIPIWQQKLQILKNFKKNMSQKEQEAIEIAIIALEIYREKAIHEVSEIEGNKKHR